MQLQVYFSVYELLRKELGPDSTLYNTLGATQGEIVRNMVSQLLLLLSFNLTARFQWITLCASCLSGFMFERFAVHEFQRVVHYCSLTLLQQSVRSRVLKCQL
jgi:hypothetical protein